jgi:hypothetical protein
MEGAAVTFPLRLLTPIRFRRPEPLPELPSEDVDLSDLDEPDVTAVVPPERLERLLARTRSR